MAYMFDIFQHDEQKNCCQVDSQSSVTSSDFVKLMHLLAMAV
jgi:hypothetical protein